MRTQTLVALLMCSLNVHAGKTDVTGALQQLKSNEDNAKSNKKQYEENESIASKNVAEVTAAIKQLREQKGQLISNSQNLDKNRAILEKMKMKLTEYTREETMQLKKEEAEMTQLRAMLTRLEANKKQRDENLAAYQQKMTEVDTEKADWDAQKQAIVQIQTELSNKETKALTEREKWMNRRKGYHDEAARWEKESELAEQHREKFDKLKN